MSAAIASLLCLAEMVYHEGRSEPPVAQLAIAYTAVNRTSDPRYPDDLCSVVHQPKTYAYYWDGKKERQPNKPAWRLAIMISGVASLGLLPDISYGATHYHTIGSSPWWAKGHTPVATLGIHEFYNDIP